MKKIRKTLDLSLNPSYRETQIDLFDKTNKVYSYKGSGFLSTALG